MKTKKSTAFVPVRTLGEFEQIHGAKKVRRLSAQLETERAKVEALAGTHEAVHICPPSADNTIRFAVIGDTHFGSLYSAAEQFRAFMRRALAAGCQVVLHAGDVLDGWKIYKGQEFELRDVGLDQQLKRLASEAKACPAGLPVKFVTGNHDESFKQLAGIAMGKAIERAARGWECIGSEQATLELSTMDGRKYTVGVYHPGGGTAYALSYKSQKAIEAMEGGRKPNMAVFGHYHKAELMPTYRNIAGVQAGTFQWQTPFMQRLASPAHVGGWIFEVQPGDSHNRVQSEFLAFYR